MANPAQPAIPVSVPIFNPAPPPPLLSASVTVNDTHTGLTLASSTFSVRHISIPQSGSIEVVGDVFITGASYPILQGRTILIPNNDPTVSPAQQALVTVISSYLSQQSKLP